VKFTARDLSHVPRKRFLNAGALSGKSIRGVSTDSRTTAAGELFVALRGENFDGHAFVDAAFARGALAAIVDESYAGARESPHPLLVVENTTSALGALARVYRDKFRLPVLVVGGSNGKTTTREMITQVLSEKYRVLSTEGNLNNHVGVPRTLFRLTARHEIAVIEIGTNHPGETRHLCQVAGPTHGMLTNIGREHLEFFETLEGVAAEEGELFAALRASRRGTGLVNADDARVRAAAAGMRKTIGYGFRARGAQVRGRRAATDATGCARFEFRTPRMSTWLGVQLRVPGVHNATNALAAITAAHAFHVPPLRMREALERFRAPGKRMESVSIGGVAVLNDTYNANPDSMSAALRTLAATAGPGRKIAVLGDMKELGAHAEEAHAAVGREAASLKIDFLLTYGTLARWIHDAAGIPGALHYDRKNMLAEYLAELVSTGDTVLVKGSRGMKMEDIVIFLEERRGPAVHT
jgi:UDP-N-acetylmuramoyl-tripeptide--D-alanyl-D-alanine ligase